MRMSARPVLLSADETLELDRLLGECTCLELGDPELHTRQYLAELIVLRQLLAAARSRSIQRTERALARLNRTSMAIEAHFAGDERSNEPPPRGSARLL